MNTAATNVLGLPGMKVVDAELLKKWRFGFDSEGVPEEEETGSDDPISPEGEEGLGGDPPFEIEPPLEEFAEEELLEAESPAEDPIDEAASC